LFCWLLLSDQRNTQYNLSYLILTHRVSALVNGKKGIKREKKKNKGLRSRMKNLNMSLNKKDATKGCIMRNPELSIAPMHRICKKAGASRVSEAAAKALAKELDDVGVKIAKEAIDYAMHAGRKTVKAEDIEIAARKVLEK
jgi:histone H3/H4